MSKKIKRKSREDAPQEYWMSYSDMMAALLLVFVLIISFTVLQATKLYEQKSDELVTEQTKLVTAEEEIKQQQEQLEAQQKQIDAIIGVRAELINEILKEFEGTDLQVSVDKQTGAISFASQVLFDFDDSELSREGCEILDDFLPRYVGILTKEEYEPFLAEILIEGHTDSQGSYMYNLELSQKRALSVAKYCLSDDTNLFNAAQMETLRKIITANGRSYSNPVMVSGVEDEDASRRVEFKFRLRDEEMVQEMSNVLENGITE